MQIRRGKDLNKPAAYGLKSPCESECQRGAQIALCPHSHIGPVIEPVSWVPSSSSRNVWQGSSLNCRKEGIMGEIFIIKILFQIALKGTWRETGSGKNMEPR